MIRYAHGLRSASYALALIVAYLMPALAFAQASPFETGATALQTNILTIATPVSIMVVMFLGIVAATGRITWGWPISVLVGIAVLFGAPQIVTWTRGMFGV